MNSANPAAISSCAKPHRLVAFLGGAFLVGQPCPAHRGGPCRQGLAHLGAVVGDVFDQAAQFPQVGDADPFAEVGERVPGVLAGQPGAQQRLADQQHRPGPAALGRLRQCGLGGGVAGHLE